MRKIANLIQRNIGYTRRLCSMMTLNAVEEWKRKFAEENIEDSDFTIKCILSHILNVGYASLSNYDSLQLTKAQIEQFDKLCECRMCRMPIQYIIGNWDFRSVNLRMLPPVFIPRPETEQLVDLVVQGTAMQDNYNILEVGCGSGAIGCALLLELPAAHCIALDSSRLACNLTQHNAKEAGVDQRITVIHHKVSEQDMHPFAQEQFDIIVSNPPYVPSRDILKLQPEIKLYEDLRALDGGTDGLDVVRILYHVAQKSLKVGGKMWLEVDCSHVSMIRETLEEKFANSLKFSNSFKDMYGKERFVEIEKL